MNLISKTGLRNFIAVGGFLVLSTAYVIHEGRSYSNGQVYGAAKGFGCECHGNFERSEATTVTISTDATVFEAGQKYTFTVRVQNPEMGLAGVNISKKNAASALDTIQGELLKRIRNTASQPFELVHRMPKTLTDGSVTWSFTYTAPSSGVDTIFAAGNAVNGVAGADANDQWNFAQSFPITVGTNSVSPRNDIAEAFAIGPNPARDMAKLFFMMKKPADLRIALVDASGREVYVAQKNDLAFGRGEVMLDLTNLSTGDYLVNVTSGTSFLYTGKISHTK